MSAKHQKLLDTYVTQIIEELEIDPTTPISHLIDEAAAALQSLRIRDLMELDNIIIKYENQLYKDNRSIDTKERLKIDVSSKIIEEATKKRKESHRRPSYPINKNVLDHAPFWAGYKHLNVKNPDLLPLEERVIKIDKSGRRKLMYQNERGQLLSLFDTRVFLGLHKLWELKGKTKEFSFHDYELLSILNLTKGGSVYNALDESIKTLFATSVIMYEFKYDNEKMKGVETKEFHLIQSKGNNVKYRSDERTIHSMTYTIRFSDYLQDSLESGYVSNISLAMLEDLNSDTAQGLYYMLHSIDIPQTGYLELSASDILDYAGIEKDQKPYRISKIITTACDQLKATDIISDFKLYNDQLKKLYIRIYPSDWFRTLNNQVTNVLESDQLQMFPL